MIRAKKLYKRLPFRPEKILGSINEKIGYKLFNHGSGLLSEFIGRYSYKKSIKIKSKYPNFNFYKSNGFSEIGFLSNESLSHLNREFDSLIESENNYLSKFSRQIRRPEKSMSLDLIINNENLDKIRSFYGTEIKIDSVLCKRNYGFNKSENTSEYFSEKWHYDGSPIYNFKLFIILKKTTLDHGPFHIHNIENSKKINLMGYKDRRNYGNVGIDSIDGIYKMTGDPGLMVLANTNYCIHRASIPKENYFRDIIVFQISLADKPFDLKNWKNDLQKKGIDKH